MNSQTGTEDFLLEIGTEELPPKSLRQLMTALRDNLCSELKRNGFVHGAAKALGTPRRLAVIIHDLAQWQPDKQVERRGPSISAAWSDKGEPTKALLGFARSCQVDDPDSLDRMATDKGEWVVFRETRRGKSIADEIEGIVNKAVTNLPIDRRMRWGAGRTEFVRPVHWVAALYGNDVLKVNILGQQANRCSYGHRFMHPDVINIESAGQYVQRCLEASVMVDFEQRQACIMDGLMQTATRFNASIDLDQALLDEVTALVEWPVVLAGSFEDEYLELPDEVLIAAMKEHQRYFHMRNQQGDLLPRFVTVANIISKDESVVIQGNEKVIRPRLSDAAFFYRNDTRTPLENKLPALKQLVFQTRLGTYYDKVVRISELAGFIAAQLGADSACAARAGLLCKADLVTELVSEFPDLQGTMGSYYVAFDIQERGKESEEVSTAIRTHYYPTASGGDLPVGQEACSVALADKLDTLTGIFGIGEQPTGSKDPYALRRLALGVIRIIIENSLTLDLSLCLAKAAELYPSRFEVSLVHQYIIERLTYWYQDQGITGDTVSAVQHGALGVSDLHEADRCIRSLQTFRTHTKARAVISANKRVANIFKQKAEESLSEINPTLFEHSAEVDLFHALNDAELAFSRNSDHQARLLILADQQGQIDRFFEEVLVMADDEHIRKNRLAVVARLRQLFLQIADFSLLQS